MNNTGEPARRPPTKRSAREEEAGCTPGSPGTWFRGPPVRITVAAVLLVAGAFAFGGSRTGLMVLLLVLFALPCALMLFMCMNGMGRNDDAAGGDTNARGGDDDQFR